MFGRFIQVAEPDVFDFVGSEESRAHKPSASLVAALHIHYLGYMDKEAAILALAALAQGTRLDTFRLLVRHEPRGLPAGELARRFVVPQNTMSAHLAVLTRAGLLIFERQSRSIIYRADSPAFEI